MEIDNDNSRQASSSTEYENVLLTNDPYEYETFFNNVNNEYKFAQTHAGYESYSTCTHLYKSFIIFDVKFVIRPRKGPKSKAKVDIAFKECNTNTDSFMTQNQIDILHSIINSYVKINQLFFTYESSLYNPLQFPVEPIDDVKEKMITEIVNNEPKRSRGRPKKTKGALNY
ncbi:unnamed protein product [Brachionus calyciflorus]|uniref:Uncharacterized protein n=1 Tax=Brachionus calyciflorus TaxID=104777 RepID=A0A814L5L1_9BILA|nr:unnamed protein product [Brachionus calyciflorus]